MTKKLTKKEQNAWFKLGLIYQCAILERYCWFVYHLHRREPELDSPFGVINGSGMEEAEVDPKDSAAIRFYGCVINAHRAAFRGLCVAKGIDPDKLTGVLPGGPSSGYAEKFSNPKTIELLLVLVDIFVGGQVDQELAGELHLWYENMFCAFLA